MCILVVGPITQFGHQFGGSIAQVQRHGCVTRLLHELQGVVYRHIGAIALGRRSKVNGTLAQRYAALGPAYLVDDVKCGIGQQ